MCWMEKADEIQEKETALCVFITPPGSRGAEKYGLRRRGLGWAGFLAVGREKPGGWRHGGHLCPFPNPLQLSSQLWWENEGSAHGFGGQRGSFSHLSAAWSPGL